MKKSYPSPRSGAAAERRYPANEVRGGGREELPHDPQCPRPGAAAGAPTKRHDRLNGYKNKTHIYVAYKKSTSDLKTHID